MAGPGKRRIAVEEETAGVVPVQTVNAESPAYALGQEFLAAAHSTSVMFANSVKAHGNLNTVSLTGLAESTKQVSSIDTIADATSLAQLLSGHPLAAMELRHRHRLPKRG